MMFFLDHVYDHFRLTYFLNSCYLVKMGKRVDGHTRSKLMSVYKDQLENVQKRNNYDEPQKSLAPPTPHLMI